MYLDFHKYNNQTQLFSSDNPSDHDVELIESILRRKLLTSWDLQNYKLSFFSGDIGVLDEIFCEIKMSKSDFCDFTLRKL